MPGASVQILENTSETDTLRFLYVCREGAHGTCRMVDRYLYLESQVDNHELPY